MVRVPQCPVAAHGPHGDIVIAGEGGLQGGRVIGACVPQVLGERVRSMPNRQEPCLIRCELHRSGSLWLRDGLGPDPCQRRGLVERVAVREFD
jgi:hypothetical protein